MKTKLSFITFFCLLMAMSGKAQIASPVLGKTKFSGKTMQTGRQFHRRIPPMNQSQTTQIPAITKSAGWCLSDKVTDRFIQQQKAADPDYAVKQHKMYQQLHLWLADNPDYLSRKTVRTVPVVVHVIYNLSQPNENVSDALVYDMINTLNEDFRRLNPDTNQTRSIFKSVAADAQIEFCLAQRDPSNAATTGIVRKQTTKTWWDPDTETDDMKLNSSGGDNAWDPYDYLNIWICDIDNDAGWGTAGYAYFPTAGMHGSWRDGLVIDNDIGIYYGSRTATHEIGHYFGLDHTWGSNPPSCYDDDGFSDTPTNADENFGCNTNQNTCNDGAGDKPDQIENYESYADCQNMFTIQQANYMNSVLSNTRSSLLSSQGCSPTAAPVANFSGTPTTVTTGQYVSFTDLTTGGPTSWSWNFGGGGTPNTSTLQNPAIQFNTVGVFTVTLTATNSMGSDVETKTSYIAVTANTTNCDTVHWTYLEVEDSLTVYYIESAYPLDSGWLTGTNAYGIANHAQLFALTEFAPNNYVSGGIFYFAYAYKAAGSNAKVVFTLWDDNGAGGAPGTVLGTDTADLADIVSDVQGGYLTERLFDSPVQVSGNYFYGFQLINYNTWGGGTSDSLALVQTADGAKAPGSQIPWCQYNTTWYSYTTLLGFSASNLFVCPYMTDLPPSANFSANTVSGCAPLSVTFDASSSVNANEFYWDTDGDDTLDGYSTSPSLTVTYSNPGTYTVELWVVGPCTGLGMMKKTNYITVNPLPALSASATGTTCGACTGTSSVAASGGTSPYTYVWNDPAPQQSAATATGLCSGSYQVLVTDAKGCSSTASATVTSPSSMVLSTSTSASTCGLSTGSATATVSGGTSPYTYSWTGGMTGSTMTGIGSGTYYVTVTDANGCTIKTDFFNAAVVGETPITVSVTVTDASCGTCSNGTATATPAGTSPYTYQWSNSQTVQTATGLLPGTYCVTATDANSCSNSSCGTVSFVVGISDERHAGILFYPNPVKNILNIDAGIFSGSINMVKIVNIIGKTVCQVPVVDSRKIITVPLHSLPDGIYYAQLVTSDGLIVKRISLVR